MASGRQRLPGTGRSRSEAPARRRSREVTPAALMLAFQRTVGNAAIGRVLARQPRQAPGAPIFNLLLVDGGNTGLERATLEAALKAVESELKIVTGASSVAEVKAGINIEVVKSLERGKPRDLGRRSFVVFLIGDKDSAEAFDLASEHVDLDQREREKHEKHIRKQIAAEGGVNIEVVSQRRRRPSQSVAFVGTDRPVKMQADKRAGPAMAGQLLADVILHELAHAAGHPEHDKEHGGIMAEKLILDSSGRYVGGHFSKESARQVRERLEALAALQ